MKWPALVLLLLGVGVAEAQIDIIRLNPSGVPGLVKQPSATPWSTNDLLCATANNEVGIGGTCNTLGGGGGGGAPVSSAYITVGTDGSLTNERPISTGIGLTGTDLGAGVAYQLQFDFGATLATNTLGAGQCLFDSAQFGLLCEGATADGNESLLAFTDPTADNIITMFNATDTVVGRNTVDTLTNKTLTVPIIASFVNAGHDHASSAGGGSVAISATTGTLALSRGGTNATTWTASRCVQVNAGGTALESASAACGTGGAPLGAAYVTVGTDATLTNERPISTGIGLTGTDLGAGVAYQLQFDYGQTLGTNTLGAGQCIFDSAENGILCEGAAANTLETLLAFPDASGSDKTLQLPMPGTSSPMLLTAGPSSTSDNAFVRWEGAAGGFVQDSGWIIDDANLAVVVTTETGVSGTTRGFDYLAQLNNTAPSTANLGAVRGRVTYAGTDDVTGNGRILGVIGSADNNGTDAADNLATMAAASFAASTNSASTTTTAKGVVGTAFKAGAGAVTTLVGGEFGVGNANASGTVTTAYTLLLDAVDTTGTVTNKWGIYQSGSEVNSFGGALQLRGTSSGASTITAGATVANMQYTLPATAPGASGYVLSTTTGGVWSWVPQSGGAPTTAQYVVAAADGTLSAEQVLSDGAGVDCVFAGGDGGAVTVAWKPDTYVNDVVLWDGTTAARSLTANLSGATDPQLVFSDAQVMVNNTNLVVNQGRIDETYTSTITSSTIAANNLTITAAPAGVTTAQYTGAIIKATAGTTAPTGTFLRGLRGHAECGADTGCSTLLGVQGLAQNLANANATADIVTAYGVYGRVQNSSAAGTIATGYAFFAEAASDSGGGITTRYAFYSNGTDPSSLGGNLILRGSSSGATTFSAGTTPATITYTLPTAAPAANGYVLSSTTSGTLSWTTGGSQRKCVSTGSIAAGAVANVSVTWDVAYGDTTYTVIGGVYEAVTSSIAAVEFSHASAKTTTTASGVVFNRDAESAHTATLCLEGMA